MRARILVTVLVLGGAAALTRADDKPLDRAELDKRVVSAVYESAVIGYELFNKGGPGGQAECARLYQGTLMGVVPMLDHRPKLQADAMKRLDRAKGLKPADAAIELRVALDEIQNGIAPPAKKDPKEMKTTLWERLGGEAKVKMLVHNAFFSIADDPKGAAFRDKKIDAAKLEQAVTAFVSANSDGPLKYNPADLKAALGGATLTDADFDALTAKMVAQLNAAKVADADVLTLGKVWEGARKDFTEKPKN